MPLVCRVLFLKGENMSTECEKLQNKKIVPVLDDDGCFAFTKKKGVDFKILQITDVHVGGGILSVKKDKMALEAVKDLICHTKPDFVAVTGDVSYPIPVFSGTCNNMRPAKKFGTMMQELGVPWAMVYGNHDWEVVATHKKDELTKYYASLSTCLFKNTAKNVYGNSNYIVKLKNEDASINNAFVFIDSNAYMTKSFFSGFDVIHDDQIEWYKNEIMRLSAGEKKIVPSLAFFHIPFQEYRDAWWKLQEKSPEVQYHFGTVSEKDQYFGVTNERGHIFDEMLKLGSTKGVFCGHDHLNTISMTYKGIRLTYGMSIDYLAYSGISKLKNQRGGTLISIKDDGSFDCELVPLTTVRNEVKGGRLRTEK